MTRAARNAPSSAGHSRGGRLGSELAESALFDVRADRYIADRFPPVLHVLSIVLAALTRLMVIGAGIAVSMLVSGVSLETGSPTFNGVPAIVALLLGWIPALFSLLFMRLGIELVASSARTARNTTLLAEAGEAAGGR